MISKFSQCVSRSYRRQYVMKQTRNANKNYHQLEDVFDKIQILSTATKRTPSKPIGRINILIFVTGSRSASRTDKRPLSSYRTVPDTYAATPLFVPSARPSKPVNVVQPVGGGGFWPPPVVFPQRQATTPDPGKSEIFPPLSVFTDAISYANKKSRNLTNTLNLKSVAVTVSGHGYFSL